jgi:nucleoside-diphosphate-sugar epimerase/predicted dehydrogenase
MMSGKESDNPLLRVAIVGGGTIARIHCQAVSNQPDTQIIAVVDNDWSRAQMLAADFGANPYLDAQSVLSELKPDVVHVLVPPQDHAKISLLALNQGCHVLVEKPMALTISDAQEMIEAAEGNKVRLCVDHSMVFEDVIQRAKALISKGTIGDLVSVEVSYLFDAKRYAAVLAEGAEHVHWAYKLHGGPLQDHFPHPASLLMEFLPDVKEMAYVGHNRGILPENWQDELRVVVKSSEALGYISISLSEKPDRITLTARGTGGTIQADLFSNILLLQKKSMLPRAMARALSGFQLSAQYSGGAIRNIYRFSRGRIDKSQGIETPISLDKSKNVVDLMTRLWPKMPTGKRKKIASAPATDISRASRTAFVTGANGFIGSYLVKRLKSENIKIRALVRPNSIYAGRLYGLGAEVIKGDLTDEELLHRATKGVQVVFHAGAATNGSWQDHERSTIDGTRNLLGAAVANRIQRFVHLSTLAVYELLDINGTGEITEDSPYQKRPAMMGAYAYAKIQAERLILDAHRSSGLGITIVRPGIVIGPGGRVFFPHLGFRYQDRLFLLIGSGDKVLPLTYVENTVQGIYQASVVKEAIGEAYNLVDDGQVTTRSYLEKLIQITGIPANVVTLPFALPYSAAAAYEIASYLGIVKKGITSRAQLKWKQAPVHFSNTKAKAQLDWKPIVSMDEALDRTFRWYGTQCK